MTLGKKKPTPATWVISPWLLLEQVNFYHYDSHLNLKGIIGVSSAYFLAKQGFRVTVIEANEEPAAYGTASFQNGGLICPAYVQFYSTQK